MRAKLGEQIAVKLPLERYDQLGQAPGLHPFPGVKLGMLRRGIDIGIAAGEAHQKPLLALAAPAPAPHARDNVHGQIVMQPAFRLGEDIGLVGADLLLELAERGLARALAGIDAAVERLPQ